MSDDYFLTGPAGTTLNVGSWVRQDEGGPDFGAQDLLQAEFSDNAISDFPRLAFERTGVRQMRFPLFLPSSGSYAGLTGLESLLRQLARPNAYVDLRPDGVASAEMVRFDILAGRWEEDYQIWHHRNHRRTGWLELDVEPFGYWPTTIILASVASLGVPGSVDIPEASILGDVPGFAAITVNPTSATVYPAGSWWPDLLTWSFGGRPSFESFLAAGSFQQQSTIIGDSFALGSQAARDWISGAGWHFHSWYLVDQTLEPAYRGRHRAYVLGKMSPSYTPAQLVVGVEGNPGYAVIQGNIPKAATANSIATLLAGHGASVISQSSPAYQLLSMGEITIPPHASGVTQTVRLKVHMNMPSFSGTPNVDIAGIILQPLDGGAGVMPRGMQIFQEGPAMAVYRSGLAIDGINDHVVNTGNTATSHETEFNARRFYVGDMPRVGASTGRIDLNIALRGATTGATDVALQFRDVHTPLSVTYRPRFTFLK